MRRRLLLFAKRPSAGRVKTRLIPLLGAEGAAAFQAALIDDALGQLRAAARPDDAVELWLGGPGEEPDAPPGVERSEQGEGDLGARLARAFERDVEAATLVIGADAPTLPAERIAQAFERLDAGADAALAPAADGGYVLLAARGTSAPLFAGIPWGGAQVLDATRRAARSADLRLAELDGWHDVDRPEDFHALRRELARSDTALRCPRTARFVLDRPWGSVI